MWITYIHHFLWGVFKSRGTDRIDLGKRKQNTVFFKMRFADCWFLDIAFPFFRSKQVFNIYPMTPPKSCKYDSSEIIPTFSTRFWTQSRHILYPLLEVGPLKFSFQVATGAFHMFPQQLNSRCKGGIWWHGRLNVACRIGHVFFFLYPLVI